MKTRVIVGFVFAVTLVAGSFIDGLFFLYGEGQSENARQSIRYSATYAMTGGGLVRSIIDIFIARLQPTLLLHGLVECLFAAAASLVVHRRIRD